MQGCDYFPKGIPGFGLKTSIKLLVRAFEQDDHSLKAIMEKKNSYFNSKQLGSVQKIWTNRIRIQTVFKSTHFTFTSKMKSRMS